MFNRYQVDYLHRKQPTKQNANPWSPSEKIYCRELAEKYYQCIETENSMDRASNKDAKCNPLIKIAHLCYRLDEEQFLNAAKDELMEDYYLDLYIQKQLKSEQFIKTKPKF